jgi:ABC-type multidrug transport system fused ATPase/permease subunit
MYYSYWLVVNKPESNVGVSDMFMLCFALALGLAQGMSGLISDYYDLKGAGASAAKLFMILDKKTHKNRKEGRSLPDVSGKVGLRDLCFKYTTRDDCARNRLSFTMETGETVAIVGESEFGKSPILQLLQKFYDITSGQILIDDTDITGLPGVLVRSQMVNVPQSPVLFSMSVKDNIRFCER